MKRMFTRELVATFRERQRWAGGLMSGDEQVAPAAHHRPDRQDPPAAQHRPSRVTGSWIPDSLVYSGLQIRIMAKI